MVSPWFIVIAICSIVSVSMQAGALCMAYFEFRDARRRRNSDD